jgi:hypothetical protein
MTKEQQIIKGLNLKKGELFMLEFKDNTLMAYVFKFDNETISYFLRYERCWKIFTPNLLERIATGELRVVKFE